MEELSSNNKPKRVQYFDQIKALMIGLVITVHAGMAFEYSWCGVSIPTGDQQGLLFQGFLQWYSYTCNSFFMCMLFLISGYFVPKSVTNKGVLQYLKERIKRLGIPFAFGLLVINNSSLLLGRFSPDSPLASIPWNQWPLNHVMVLWFLIVLFAFDLIYCTWVKLSGASFLVDTSIETPKLRSWLISASALAIVEIGMSTQQDFWRLLLSSPLDGIGVQGIHLFTYAFLFFLGCKAASHHWLERIDTHLAVRWFRLSLCLSLFILGLTLTLKFQGETSDYERQLNLLELALNTFIGWGFMARILVWFQRTEAQWGPWLAQAGVDSFGAYIIHPLILVMAIMLIGFIGLNHWIIFIGASILGIIISFSISHQLRRIPIIAKVI